MGGAGEREQHCRAITQSSNNLLRERERERETPNLESTDALCDASGEGKGERERESLDLPRERESLVLPSARALCDFGRPHFEHSLSPAPAADTPYRIAQGTLCVRVRVRVRVCECERVVCVYVIVLCVCVVYCVRTGSRAHARKADTCKLFNMCRSKRALLLPGASCSISLFATSLIDTVSG